MSDLCFWEWLLIRELRHFAACSVIYSECSFRPPEKTSMGIANWLFLLMAPLDKNSLAFVLDQLASSGMVRTHPGNSLAEATSLWHVSSS